MYFAFCNFYFLLHISVVAIPYRLWQWTVA